MTLLPPPGPSPDAPVPPAQRVDVPDVPGTGRSKLPFLIAGGALVLLLGGLGIAYAIVAAQRTPEAAVSQFLDKLVAGEAGKAQKLLASIPAGNPALLQPDTYEATGDRITGYSILETSTEGDRAVASVEFEQAGETYTEELELERVGKDLGVFDVWRIDGASMPIVYLTYPRPDGMGLDVNGTELGGFENAYQLEVPAWPGTYEFVPTGATDEYGSEPVTVTVRFGGMDASTTAALTVELTEAGTAAATAAVNARLDSCLAQPALNPGPNCGFGVVQDDATYTNIRWTLLARPAVAFGSYTSDGWAVSTSAPGSMRLDADYSTASETGTAESVIDGFEQGGFILSFTDGAAEFESWIYQ